MFIIGKKVDLDNLNLNNIHTLVKSLSPTTVKQSLLFLFLCYSYIEISARVFHYWVKRKMHSVWKWYFAYCLLKVL